MAADLRPMKEENYAFTTCILRVNVRTNGWQKIVSTVLSNIQGGLNNFRMDEDGRIEVSGTVDPSLLLKILAKAGNRAELCWWQFGQCSSNLYIPEYRDYHEYGSSGYNGDDSYYGWRGQSSGCHRGGYGGHTFYGDDRHLHYGGYGDRPQPRSWYQPLKEPPGHGFPLAPLPSPANTPQIGEGVGCCSLM
ncbi:hypothetical protein ACSBR1_033771 [Camellia fascicularis]